MTGHDIAFGFLSGIVSFFTPEALTLLPLVLAAIAARGRAAVYTPVIGLGLALVLTSMLATAFGRATGQDAIWLRRILCGVAILLGTALVSRPLVERFSAFTGGAGGFSGPAGGELGSVFRQILLSLLIGAIWIPKISPTLGKALMMAADGRDLGPALGTIFAFGAGAALPPIVIGRVSRRLLSAAAAGMLEGLAGKRVLGLALIVVAGLAVSGFDTQFSAWVDQISPAPLRRLHGAY